MQENGPAGIPLILLTGATGYVGGRLLRRLEADSQRVRCLARRPESLLSRVSQSVEVFEGDILDPQSLDRALEGVHTAYYLIHSLSDVGDFAKNDAIGARHFALAAARRGVHRIIYLGGLGEATSGLSKHLRSRQEVGDILRGTGVPVVEFRASMVIGAGSLSFELVRALVEGLPVMITPKWVSIPAQPIAIADVLDYLIAALHTPEAESRVFEIGGGDVVSYGGIMRAYGEARRLKRWLIPVPVLTPYLSSLWLSLVTPVYARVGRSLIEGVRNSTLVRDDSALRVFNVRPMGIRQAIAEAINSEDHDFEQMRLSEFFAQAEPSRYWGGVRLGSRVIDTRTARVSAEPEDVFGVICSIGGADGYFHSDWLWRLRGLLDRMVGGVGMRGDRRSAPEPVVGDEIDWWRVERVEHNRLLRLRAEMKLPGRAWLDFEVTREGDGTLVRQTAVFDPLGLSGRLYWWALYPAHNIVFAGMLKGIVERCSDARPRGNRV